MKSVEGEAAVLENALVGDIESSDCSCESFSEILVEGEIEGGVTVQIVALVGLVRNAGFSLGEAGAAADVGRRIGAPGKADVSAHVQRVPRVMVERTESRREREIGEATGDGAAAPLMSSNLTSFM